MADTKQIKLDEVNTDFTLEHIIYKLLVSNSSSWINSAEVNKFINNSKCSVKELISEMQHWFVNNVRTRTRARFLEKYCNNETITFQRYLGLAWSILFFDGIKLNSSTRVVLKEKSAISKNKFKINEFNDTLSRIKQKHKLTNKDLREASTLLRHYIKSNKIRTFKYYGVTEGEWKANKVSYKFLKKNLAEL